MRKNISLSIEDDDLKKFDDLCEYLSGFYRVKFSRTNTINFLVCRLLEMDFEEMNRILFRSHE